MEIKITEKEAGNTVKEYFSLLKLSKRQITRLKNRERGITVNGERKTVRYELKSGDLLNIEVEDFESSEIEPSFLPLNILYEDEWYIAVEKTANLPIHPSKNHQSDTLASRVMAHFGDKNFVFRVLTRLDRDTSGTVLIAKSALSASLFSKMLEKREVEKKYIALCQGTFKEKEGKIDYNIRRISPYNIKREAVEKSDSHSENSPYGNTALTYYKVLKEKDGFSLVLFTLVTGRTHQIRVHSSAVGCPVLADTLYSEPSPILSRQALHAKEISFIHPFTKEKVSIVCPLSEDIQNAEKVLFHE